MSQTRVVLLFWSWNHQLSPSGSRLLLVEEHYERVLVHPVALWHAHQVRERAGGAAHHDTSEPQGGTGVRVCLQFTGLSRAEANPMHCVNADQRAVFLPLTVSWQQATSALAASDYVSVEARRTYFWETGCEAHISLAQFLMVLFLWTTVFDK